MANYIIIGGDQKEYDAVTAEVVRQWMSKAGSMKQSMVKAEGEAEFRPLGTFSRIYQRVHGQPADPKTAAASVAAVI